jgi:hypothetical protein
MMMGKGLENAALGCGNPIKPHWGAALQVRRSRGGNPGAALPKSMSLRKPTPALASRVAWVEPKAPKPIIATLPLRSFS